MVTGSLLGGIGELHKNHHPNFLVVEKDTTISEIEDAFRQFLNRDDIGTILINQHIAEMVQHALDAHQRSIPAVLEIPSKEHPYDAARDSILLRAKGSSATSPLSLPGLSQFAILYLSFKPWFPAPPLLFTKWLRSCWGSALQIQAG
ncbi:V-type proton ATPase subunit F [Microtus ochrogaster]|uniref:V-ATPase 14 kDa subunit n=1 Tax=Microtus ochrogaster TaxID=79684 RepID=A0A8J6G7X1_MICOH|nr:V-type proton ATPase subunit F [Microtus ochrogaster]